MERIKITDHQLTALTAIHSLGGSILLITSIVTGIAKQDAWIAALIAVGYGIPVFLIYFFLGSKYPGLSLIGITRNIFGKWIGFIISAVFVYEFFNGAFSLPWQIASYFTRVMHETPPYIIGFFFTIVMVVAVLYGIEAIARASEIMFVIVTILFIIFIAFLIKDIKGEYITPVLGNGILPAMKASLFLSAFITFPNVNILMIYPRYFKGVQGKKALLNGFFWAGAVSFVTLLMSVLVLGSELSSKLSFPALYLAMNINIGNFLTRFEYVISMLWIFSQTVVGVVFLYAAVAGLSELVGLKDHRKIVLPAGLFVYVISIGYFPNSVYLGNMTITGFTPFITTVGFIIPLLMMVVYLIKRRFFNIV